MEGHYCCRKRERERALTLIGIFVHDWFDFNMIESQNSVCNVGLYSVYNKFILYACTVCFLNFPYLAFSKPLYRVALKECKRLWSLISRTSSLKRNWLGLKKFIIVSGNPTDPTKSCRLSKFYGLKKKKKKKKSSSFFLLLLNHCQSFVKYVIIPYLIQ